MNRKAHRVSVAIMLTASTMTAYGPDDLKQIGTHPNRQCAVCDHNLPQDGCPHKRPINPAMCWTNGGQGVNQCPGQTQQNCGGETRFHDVRNDFPQGEGDNGSANCITDNTGGPTAQPMWAAHTYVTSPAANCYRTVECQWNPSTSKCEIKPGSEGPWFDLPKRRSNPCSDCIIP